MTDYLPRETEPRLARVLKHLPVVVVSGLRQVWRGPVEGGERVPFTGLDPSVDSVAFSPDGRQVAYEVRSQGSGGGIWKMDGLFDTLVR